MDQVKQMFSKFDKNGDGKISITELHMILNAMGTTATMEEAEQMMKEIDSDGDGFIDLKEFEAFYFPNGGAAVASDKEIRDAFNLYDKDQNGKISAAELHSVLKSLGEKCSIKDVKKMIKSVDIDGDGCVNFDEFKKMMSNGVA